MLENGVLGRLFGPKREEVTGGLRKLHISKSYNFCSSISSSKVVKSWTGHTTQMRVIRNSYKMARLGDIQVNRRLILKWSSKQVV
jgi:hypothetical protein